MKDGIKKILDDMQVFCKAPYSRDALAQRITDSIEVDEDKLYEVILTWYRKWGTCTQRLKPLQKAIAKAKPLRIGGHNG